MRGCSVRVTQDGGKPSNRWSVIPWTKLMGDQGKAAFQQHDHVEMSSLSVSLAVCYSALPESSRSQTKLTSRPRPTPAVSQAGLTPVIPV